MPSHRRRRHDRGPSLLPLIALAGAAWLVWSVLCDRPAPARCGAAIRDNDEDAGAGPSTGDYVRPAGPHEMRDPPRRWSKLDEELDESFPASDPPGNY